MSQKLKEKRGWFRWIFKICLTEVAAQMPVLEMCQKHFHTTTGPLLWLHASKAFHPTPHGPTLWLHRSKAPRPLKDMTNNLHGPWQSHWISCNFDMQSWRVLAQNHLWANSTRNSEQPISFMSNLHYLEAELIFSWLVKHMAQSTLPSFRHHETIRKNQPYC